MCATGDPAARQPPERSRYASKMVLGKWYWTPRIFGRKNTVQNAYSFLSSFVSRTVYGALRRGPQAQETRFLNKIVEAGLGGFTADAPSRKLTGSSFVSERARRSSQNGPPEIHQAHPKIAHRKRVQSTPLRRRFLSFPIRFSSHKTPIGTRISCTFKHGSSLSVSIQVALPGQGYVRFWFDGQCEEFD
jgi:hypothetical protein